MSDMERAEQRVRIVNAHLKGKGDAGEADTAMPAVQPVSLYTNGDGGIPDPRQLYPLLAGHHLELRERVFEIMNDDLFVPNPYASFEGLRELTLWRLKKVAEAELFSVRDYVEDPLKFAAVMECLSFRDYNLAIKAGVHYTLCGGTIAKLGTRKHHEMYIAKLDTLELPGCFGMTEVGHGSNVSGIETTAEYDPRREEFVLHTPSDEASKFWIGGAAQHGKVCTVFAQLKTGGKWQGVHVFAVRLRDDNGHVLPGIRIEDCGHKMGLNGVDNGRIWFHNHRVPRDTLLDRFAQVAPDGTYSSPIASQTTRFGTMIGGLVFGRLLIAQGAVDASKVTLAVAIKYSANRPQFGDRVVMDYITHQRRLIVPLSAVYGLNFAMLAVKRRAAKKNNSDAESRKVHEDACGLKAACTWTRVETMQACRECCGGMGYLSANQIGTFKTDMDVDVTFEGDNTVLMQQTARPYMEAAKKRINQMLGPPVKQQCPIRNTLALLEFRVQTLARRAVTEVKQAGGGETALGSNLDLVVSLGWAAVEMLVFHEFAEAARGAPTPVQADLVSLCTLYGLSRIERAASFFLEYGALQPSELAGLRSSVNGLCGGFAEDGARKALALVEGFGIPPYLLTAPIANDWRSL